MDQWSTRKIGWWDILMQVQICVSCKLSILCFPAERQMNRQINKVRLFACSLLQCLMWTHVCIFLPGDINQQKKYDVYISNKRKTRRVWHGATALLPMFRIQPTANSLIEAASEIQKKQRVYKLHMRVGWTRDDLLEFVGSMCNDKMQILKWLIACWKLTG